MRVFNQNNTVHKRILKMCDKTLNYTNTWVGLYSSKHGKCNQIFYRSCPCEHSE